MRVHGKYVENDRLIFIFHFSVYFLFAFLMERAVKELALEYKKKQKNFKCSF